MDHMVASRVFCVEVGTLEQHEQCKICGLTFISDGVVTLIVCYDTIVSVCVISNTKYQLLFTSMYPCKQTNKQTSLDRLTANRRTIGITSNLQQYVAGCILSRTCKLTVVHSLVTCSLLYIHQDFPLFFIIFLTFSTTASHGSTNTSARCDSIPMKPDGGPFIQCAPG
jgi:hypothetical protein